MFNYFIAQYLLIMTINLIIFLTTIHILYAETPLSKCFYNQKLSIISGSPFAVQSGGYSYQITWDLPQQNIESSAYVLNGYRIQAGYSLLSFNAGVNNLTSTGAQFIFDPQVGSAILKAFFSIILKKTCMGYIEIRYVEFNSPEFSLTGRSVDDSFTSINLYRSLGIPLSKYQTQTFISSFVLTSYIGKIQLRVTSILSFPALVSFKMLSNHNHNNIFSKICFSFIIIDVSSFYYQISTFKYTYQATTLTPPLHTVSPNFKIPSNFNPQLNQKCIIGLQWILTQNNNAVTEMRVIDSGIDPIVQINSVAVLNNDFLIYAIICIQDCVNGYVNFGTSTSVCIPCALGIDLCERCYPAPNPMCAGCTSGNYLMLSINKCYGACLPGYYGNSSYVCLPCLDECLTCNNSTTCITCKFGQMVTGGCTAIEGCVAVLSFSSPENCLECRSADMFELNGTTCRCKTGYFLVTHLCIDIIGCIAAKRINNKTICVGCNVMRGFLLKGGTCECKIGYELSVDTCLQKCGDGISFNQQCDDGNTDDGDGCSSSCKIQKCYQCLNGSHNSTSICKYYGPKIALSIKHINKAQLIHQGIFTFTLRPAFSIFQKLNFSQIITFDCLQSNIIKGASYSKGQLTVNVEYFENLQGNPATLTIMLDSNHFSASNASIHFDMISQGSILVLNNHPQLQIFQRLTIALSAVAFFIFIISNFTHKIIGLEILTTFQIVYLVHLSANDYTEPFGIIKYLSLTSWKLWPLETVVNIKSVWLNVTFSSQSELVTLVFMTGFIFVVSFLILISMSKNILKYLTDSKGRMSSSLSLYLYNHIFFPFTMGFCGIFLIISSREGIQNTISSFVAQFIRMFLTIIISFIYFAEWKYLFVSQRLKHSFSGLRKCSTKYIPFHLTMIFLTGCVVSVNFTTKSFSLTSFLLVIEIIFLFWKIITWPYQLKMHNIGITLNSVSIVLFLIWTISRQHFPIIQAEEIQVVLLFIISVILLICIIVTFIRMIFQILTFCRQSKQCQARNKDSQKIVTQNFEPKITSKIQDSQLMKYQINENIFGRQIYSLTLRSQNEPMFLSEVNNLGLLNRRKMNHLLLQNILANQEV